MSRTHIEVHDEISAQVWRACLVYLEPEMGTGDREHEEVLDTRLFSGARRWAKQSEGSWV